jgi:hypothetical protein
MDPLAQTTLNAEHCPTNLTEYAGYLYDTLQTKAVVLNRGSASCV